MSFDELAASHGRALLRLAAQSIEHGLKTGTPFRPDVATADPALRAPAATFVTLEAEGQLRGCVGTILPRRPLIEDVAENAFAAVFRDTRFESLTAAERPAVTISISLLGPLTDILAADELTLLSALRPHIDGVLISDNSRRAVFLPQVWGQLPDPHNFLGALKAKGGFPSSAKPPSLRAQRFTVTEIAPVPMVELD